MHLRGPAPHVMGLYLAQCDRHRSSEGLQARKSFAVHRDRAVGETPLHSQVLEVTHDIGIELHARRGHARHGREAR